jgi:hypothetical protein
MSHLKNQSRHLGIKWADGFKIELKEVWSRAMDWIQQAQDRNQRWAILNTIMNLQVPYVENFLSNSAISSISRKTISE